MILPIITLLVIIASFVIGFRWTRKNGEAVGLSICVGLISTLFGFAINVVIWLLIASAQPNIEETYYYNIVSLNNQLTTEGNFVLGSGTIKGVEYYFYFIKRDDGGYKRDSVKTNETIIYEDDNELSKLKWKEVRNNMPKWLGPDIVGIIERKDYKLFVPKGTIIKEFTLR